MSIIKKNTRFMLSMSLILGSSFASQWPDDLNSGMDNPFQNEPVLTDWLPSTNIGSESSMETGVDLPKIQPQKQVSGIALKIPVVKNNNLSLPSFQKKSPGQNSGLISKTPVTQDKPTVQKNVTQNRQVQGSGLQPKTSVVSINRSIPVAHRNTTQNVSVRVPSNPQKISNSASYFDDLFSQNQIEADNHKAEQEKLKIQALKAEELKNNLKAQHSLQETQLPAFMPPKGRVASGGVQPRGVLGNRGREELAGIPNLQSVGTRHTEQKQSDLLKNFEREFSQKFTTTVETQFDLYESLMSDSLNQKMKNNFDFITSAIGQKGLLKDLYNLLSVKQYNNNNKFEVLKGLERLGFTPIGSEGNDKWIYKNKDQVVVRLKLEQKYPAYNICMYGKDEIIRAADSNTKPASGTDTVLRAANKGRNVNADLTKQLCLIYLFPKNDGTISYRLLPSHPGSFSDSSQNNGDKDWKIIRLVNDLLGTEAEKYDIRNSANTRKYVDSAINCIMRLGHGKFNGNFR